MIMDDIFLTNPPATVYVQISVAERQMAADMLILTK